MHQKRVKWLKMFGVKNIFAGVGVLPDNVITEKGEIDICIFQRTVGNRYRGGGGGSSVQVGLSFQGRTGRGKGNQKGVDETQVDRYFFSKHFLKLNEYFRLFSEKLKTSVNQQDLLKTIFLTTAWITL